MSVKCSDNVVSQMKFASPPLIALGIKVEKPILPQYAVYSKRMESFESWPEYIPVKKEDLVEAGLVYTGVGDSVRCYFCGGGLRNWEQGDVPMEEHGKWYPKCPHVMLVMGPAYIERLQRGEKPEETSQAQTNSTCAAPSHDYHSEGMLWIASDVLNERLGVCDLVRCYFCGGGLMNWEQSDVPMEKHGKWYPKCPHIMLVKGRAYIERLHRGGIPGELLRAETNSACAVPNHLESVAALSCIENGYSNEMVQKAVGIFINRHGNSDFKAADLCEILFDFEEEVEEITQGVDESDRCYAFSSGGLRSLKKGYSQMNKQDRMVPSGWRGQFKNFPTILANEESQNDLLPDQTSATGPKCLESIAAQSCIQMGYPEYLVYEAIKTFKERNGGRNDFKGEDLCKILLYELGEHL